MEVSDRQHLVIERGINYSALCSSLPQRLSDLGAEDKLINEIENKILAKKDFQVEVDDLRKVIDLMKNKITELLDHPDLMA